jgi:hypothetical protein
MVHYVSGGINSIQFNSIRFILEVVQLLLHARLVAPATNANKHIQFRVVIGLVYTTST